MQAEGHGVRAAEICRDMGSRRSAEGYLAAEVPTKLEVAANSSVIATGETKSGGAFLPSDISF